MKFAIVGAGAMARLRKAALDASKVASCIGVFDIDPARAARLAGDGAVYTSLDALISDPGIDAVIISTPPDTHARIAISAMLAGKHVLVEKPMANSLAACQEMLKVARQTDRVLTVGFNHRYFPAIADVRRAVRDGEIGDLCYVRGFTGHTGLSEFKSDWMYAKDVMGGGTLMDNGIHLIDLVSHVMGPVNGVQGKVQNRIWNLGESEDNAFGILTGTDGVIGTLNASWSEWKGYHFFIEAYGTRGMARAYYAPMQSMVITMSEPGGRSKKRVNRYLPLIIREKLQGWQYSAVKTLVLELADFVSLVNGEAVYGPIARAEDGLRATEIANLVYESSSSGVAVELSKAP